MRPGTPQVLASSGIHFSMEAPSSSADLVRCLSCRTVYAKPADGRAPTIPACPQCGYVGWIAVSIPLPPAGAGGARAYRI